MLLIIRVMNIRRDEENSEIIILESLIEIMNGYYFLRFEIFMCLKNI